MQVYRLTVSNLLIMSNDISVVIYDDGSSFLLKQHPLCIHTGWSKISDTGLNAHYSFKEQI